ncbi:MAG: PAS domain S-box protein [Bacteroidales bacterium]|nr:PAS domain S-box protein [Bacteroidales bacterium]
MTNNFDEKNAILQSVYKAAPIGIGFVKNRVILEVNDKFCSIVGYSRKEIIGKDSAILYVSKEEYERVGKEKYLQIEKTGVGIIETKYKKKDGQIIDVKISSAAIDSKDLSKGYSFTILDITKEKNAEKIITENEKLLSTIIDAIAAPVFYKDKKGLYIGCNQKFADYFGISKEEIIGKTPFDIAPENLAKIYHNADMEILQKGEIQIYEADVLGKNNVLRHFMFHKSPFKNQNDEIIGLVGAMLDITERKNLETALYYSEKKFAAAFNNSPVVITLTYLETGKYFEINNAFTRELEYTREEVIGKTSHDLGVFKDANERNRLVSKLIEKGFIENEECEFVSKSGKIITALLSLSILNSNNQKFILSTVINITEQKKNSLALAESEEKYRMIAENATDVIWRLNIASGKFEYISPSVFHLRGLTVEEAMNENFIETMSEESREMAKSALKNINEDQLHPKAPSSNFLIQQHHKNGNLIWVEISAKALRCPKSGQIIILGASRNVNDRVKAQQELVATKEKAVEADKLKSVFLANMSHEIRTPMNSILGFSDLLTDDELNKETKEKYLNIIKKSGNQLMTIINDLIDISKIEANQISIRNTAISLHQTLYDLKFHFEKQASEKGINFIYEVKPEFLNCIVSSDANRIRQIVNNFLQNSIKFTEKGEISFGYKIENEIAEIFVEDSGIGIPIEEHKSVFERFRQVNQKSYLAGKGVGLGLSIAGSLVKLLGSEITLSSSPGKGSRFSFKLKTLKNQETPKNIMKTYQESITTNYESSTILVADDEEDNIILLQEMLEKNKFSLILARNGEEAVEQAIKHPEIDLILMDIKMPLKNGMDATKEIKALRSNLPIIAQTAFALSTEREEILNSGFDDYISKPISAVKLLDLIRKNIKK